VSIIITAVCALVFVAIMVALALILWRTPRGTAAAAPDVDAGGPRERTAFIAVASALGVSTVLLFGLVVASVFTDRALAQLALHDAINIEMTGHMWWWEIKYTDGTPQQVFVTANEIHVPVGRPVIVTLRSEDVIHSFWVPNLHGKKDLIPGRIALIEFRADRPGIFRGQCAEFCGFQHAKMAFDVVAESPQQYDEWVERQRQPAAPPADAELRRGQEVFETSTCAMCHAIVGSQARGRRAPDLTHFASRRMIGAGAVPNTFGHLAGWVVDAQALKPGVLMPPNPLPPQDEQALIAYLRSLK
jgi:cytochrome c oxidase subunit 2